MDYVTCPLCGDDMVPEPSGDYDSSDIIDWCGCGNIGDYDE